MAFSSPALAQSEGAGNPQATVSNEATPERAENGLEDIVVTATRREERLQTIPVAVTALTSEAIESSGVQDVRSLTQVVPGFFGGKNIGLFLPVIRGVGSSSVSAADEANVATYIDGVYQPDPYSTFVDLAEVERVEVLRGPQGTVFGRNATGGLINVITPDPSFELRGNISARYGRLRNDASDLDAKAYVTGGLTETLAADLSVVYRKTDDYITDLVRGGNLGGNRIFNLRGKLLWEASDAARFVLTAEYADQDGSTNTTQPFNGNTAGRRFAGAVVPAKAWQSSVDTVPVLDFKRFNLALRTRFDLGSVNLETTTGYMHTRTIQVTDSDASNIFLGVVSANEPNINTKSLSQEIRLLSTAPGPFQWLIGLYGFRLDSESGLRILSRPAGPGTVQTSTSLNPTLKTTSYSGFGEGTYRIVPQLFLTLGVRYTWEQRKFEQIANGVNLFGEASRSFDKVTYRGALRYEFADSANVYATYGTGYKSGVYNFTSTTPTPVDPETIDAYEVGLKVDPLSWLRMNLSTYYYDYQNLQVVARASSGNTFILQNAASAEIYGGEIELTAAVTRHLKIRASAAYTHSEYKDFPNAQGFVPLPLGGNSSVSEDASGNQLTRSPESSLALGAVWTKEIANGTFGIAGNVYHSSRVYFDFANRFSQKPYTLVSGELSYTTSNDNWRFTVWATNLTNQQVYREIRNGPLTTDVTYESPRRVGVGASYRF
ncbi:TonB-dependent receptor [Sphingobium sp. BS19]|uniref:TonB-dependent receptor n=1 Tax=Sphingobium sp. BS19 TaxID=3018973 RepID=UPI0024934223|nr:TonB-dependent receptor [Sphingobium sp. BS19]